MLKHRQEATPLANVYIPLCKEDQVDGNYFFHSCDVHHAYSFDRKQAVLLYCVLIITQITFSLFLFYFSCCISVIIMNWTLL